MQDLSSEYFNLLVANTLPGVHKNQNALYTSNYWTVLWAGVTHSHIRPIVRWFQEPAQPARRHEMNKKKKRQPSHSGGCRGGGGEKWGNHLTCSTGFQRASSRRGRCARGASLASWGTWPGADGGGQVAGSCGDGDVGALLLLPPPLPDEDEQQGGPEAGDPVHRRRLPPRGPPPLPPPPPILPRHCSYCCFGYGQA
jgi:hypothetical protein